jgi:uncharacterized membrane protein YbhN (UPF0104 family)
MSENALWKHRGPWLRLIGLVLLGLILWRLDFAALVRIIRGADRVLLGIAVVLNLLLVLLKSLRWRALMVQQDIRYPIGKAYLAYFGSISVGFLTPGRLGEFVKAIHVNHDCDVSPGRALSSVLVDRLFDLYALLLVGGAALLTLAVGRAEVIALIGSALLLMLPLGLFLNDTAFGYLRQVCLRLGPLGRKLSAPGGWLPEMRLGLRQLTWSGFLTGIVLTILAYSIFFGQCHLLARALELSVGLVPVCYAVALGSLVTLLPISISGLGTREAAIIVYLGTVEVPREAALGFSLLVFLTFYVAGGLIGAVAWWLKPAPLAEAATRAGELLHSTEDR